jgi:hypothetical protein
MRIRSIVLVALTAPAILGAQVVRGGLPRPGRTAENPTAREPLPPTAPEIGRALAYKRSRWALEGYSMVSTFNLQDLSGGASGVTAFGGGTRGAYRINDYVHGTMDASAVYGGWVTAGTIEAGTRFSFMPHDEQIHPYFDVRGAFVQMRDVDQLQQTGLGVGTFGQYSEGGRYSHGFGTVVGSGFEYQIHQSFAISTGISAMRARMNGYRFTGAATVPAQTNYWMTSYRYVLGIKYNPSRLLNALAQTKTNK